MRNTLKVGISGQLRTVVGPDKTITLGDISAENDQSATVFSTPSMINLMERAAREALRPHLEDDEDSVGIDVRITHTSATPPTAQVIAQAIVTSIEKNVIGFELVARDPWGEIGCGTHRRAVIKTSRFARKLADQKPISSVNGSDTQSAVLDSNPILSGPGEHRSTVNFDSFRTIQCAQTGNILQVTLNRPAKRNVCTREMTREMEQLICWLDTQPAEKRPADIRVVVMTGAGDTFCAGDDVGDLPEDLDQARELSLRRGKLHLRITNLPQVFISAIDGMALGGGLVLAASSDYRIATHRAGFALPEVLLGWLPNYGMGIVQSLIGRGRTLELALTGETISARQAQDIGLINRVVAQSQLMASALAVARKLEMLSPGALAATKRLMAPGTPWCDASAADAFVECLTSETARGNIQRFSRK